MLKKIKQQLKLDKVLPYLLYLFLFLLPWQTIWIYRESFLHGVKWEYGTLGFYGTEILLWLIICLFLIWYWKQHKFQISNFKFQITSDRVFIFSCFLFTAYYFFSIIWSPDKSMALSQSLHMMEAILLFLIIFIGPFEKEKLVKWFLYGAILPSLLGLWQFLAQSTFAFKWLGIASHPVWEAGTSIMQSDAIGRWLRAYGSFAHPNVFGGYLVIVIVILLNYYIVNPLLASPYKGEEKTGPPPFIGEEKTGPPPFIGEGSLPAGKAGVGLFLIAYLLSLVALFFTFSRSAWMAVVIVALLYCYIVIKNRKNTSPITYHLSPIIYLVSLFIILSIIFFPVLSSRLSASSTNEAQSITERLGGYDEAWQLLKQNPLLGAGAGNYTLAAYQINSNRGGWEYQPAHNAFALFMVEGGIIGVGLFIFVIVSFITYHVSRITYQRNCYTWYVLCVMCYVFLAMFDHYLYSSYIGLILSAVYFGLILRTNTQVLPS